MSLEVTNPGLRRAALSSALTKVIAPSIVTLEMYGHEADDDAGVALNAAQAALTTGGIIYIPRGTYRFDTNPQITNDNIRIIGDGPGTVLLESGHRTPIKLASVSNVTVENLTIQGTQNGANRTNLLTIDGNCENITIRGVHLRNSSSTCIAITGEGTGQVCRNILIEDCHGYDFYECFQDCVRPSVYGLRVRYCTARTSAANPHNPSISRPYFAGLEPQVGAVIEDYEIVGCFADFSGVPVPDRNQTQFIAIGKHAIPASDFVLKRARFINNTIRGFGSGFRLIGTRYGTATAGFNIQINDNFLEMIRGEAIRVEGGEDGGHYDLLQIMRNSIKGWSEATSNGFDAIVLDGFIHKPHVAHNTISRRHNETGGVNGRDGVYVGANVTAPRLGPNDFTFGRNKYNVLTTGAVYQDADAFVSVAMGAQSMAQAATISYPGPYIATSVAGYYSAGDGGGAKYKRVATQPSHAGKFRSADRYLPNGTIDNTNGGWWEIDEPILNLRMFGAKGDNSTNDTTSVKNCLAMGGSIFVPPGTFLADADPIANTGALLVSNTTLFGAGEASILKPFTITSRSILACDSGSSSAFISNVTLSGLKLLGSVATNGHFEQGHLLHLNGVRKFVIHNCFFEGPRGDAVYLGSNTGMNERHNIDVTIRDCIFDGVINNADGGRNAISVIDIDGIVIEGSVFRNWSKNNMPGSIDFEPNQAFSVVKNVRISNNKFSNCAGNRGHITFAMQQTTTEFYNVVITNNQFSSNVAICMYVGDALLAQPNNIIIANNISTENVYFINHVVGSLWNVSVINNQIYGTGSLNGRIYFAAGGTAPTYTLRNINLSGNQILCSATIPFSIPCHTEQLTIIGNLFNGMTQAAMRLGTTGTGTVNVTINGNTFIGASNVKTVQHDCDIHNPLTNAYFNNISSPGMTHTFRAARTDQAGSLNGYIAISTAPSLYPFGRTAIRYSNGAVVNGSGDTGMVITMRPHSAAETSTCQIFLPDYNGSLNDFYIRKAQDANTWSAWRKVVTTTAP